uniref:Transmembrane protein n=1 Tax=Chromera velia CCMP2878 TaxID=1169474 RepID=A0A0G4HBW9_9ALVE|eukprot:Cvel_6258.t1-p1 / transcript=Cvel_6258.t1 / gene=Cvel_6258 / organism=Chromera_velia_CCMP2878 / gene_product=hypothetical protein / transcript_product=hypothetical protein / location=Cvel_scaffold303:38514-41657(+) / protein_length=798 / sequence_SO=supercontig / SO=protein_coding / is_pseudo=false
MQQEDDRNLRRGGSGASGAGVLEETGGDGDAHGPKERCSAPEAEGSESRQYFFLQFEAPRFRFYGRSVRLMPVLYFDDLPLPVSIASLSLGAITGIGFASMDASVGMGSISQQLMNVSLGVFFCVPAFVRRSLPRGFTRKEAECILAIRAVQDGWGRGDENDEGVELCPGAEEDLEGGGEDEGNALRSGAGVCGFRLVFATSAIPEVNRVWWHGVDTDSEPPAARLKDGEGKGGEEGEVDEASTKKLGKCRRFWGGVGRVAGLVGGALQGFCVCWWTVWSCCRSPIAAAGALDSRRLLLALITCLVFLDFTSDIAVGVQLTMAGVYDWSENPVVFDEQGRSESFGPAFSDTPIRAVFREDGTLSHYEGVSVWDDRYADAQAAGVYFNLTIPPPLPERVAYADWPASLQREAREGGFNISKRYVELLLDGVQEHREFVTERDFFPKKQLHKYLDLGDFVLLPHLAAMSGRLWLVGPGLRIHERRRARHILLKKVGRKSPQPPGCSEVEWKYFWDDRMNGTRHQFYSGLLNSSTAITSPSCLVGTIGVQHLLECPEGCGTPCSSLLKSYQAVSGKLLCPMDRVEDFRPSFWCGIAILFLSLFDMLNVVVVQVMMVNAKSFRKSWRRFLLSFLLSLTEVFILALSLYGYHIEDNQDMSRAALYFSVASTVLIVLWKSVRVLATRLNFCKRWRKLDEFLEKEPPESLQPRIPSSKQKQKQERGTVDRSKGARTTGNLGVSTRRTVLPTAPSFQEFREQRSRLELDLEFEESRGSNLAGGSPEHHHSLSLALPQSEKAEQGGG